MMQMTDANRVKYLNPTYAWMREHGETSASIEEMAERPQTVAEKKRLRKLKRLYCRAHGITDASTVDVKEMSRWLLLRGDIKMTEEDEIRFIAHQVHVACQPYADDNTISLATVVLRIAVLTGLPPAEQENPFERVEGETGHLWWMR